MRSDISAQRFGCDIRGNQRESKLRTGGSLSHSPKIRVDDGGNLGITTAGIGVGKLNNGLSVGWDLNRSGHDAVRQQFQIPMQRKRRPVQAIARPVGFAGDGVRMLLECSPCVVGERLVLGCGDGPYCHNTTFELTEQVVALVRQGAEALMTIQLARPEGK
jgi:hypothetical protein